MVAEAYRVDFAVAPLNRLTDSQLDLLLNGARAFNDIMMLQRLAAARDREAQLSDAHEKAAQLTLLFMTLMLLAGKMWECWEVIDRSAKLWKPGETAFPLKSRGLRKRLSRRFHGGSLLHVLRNTHSFHYDKKSTDVQIQAIRNGRLVELPAIAGETHPVTLFMFAEHLAAEAVLSTVYPSLDRQSAMNALFSEIIETAHDLGELLNEIIPCLLHSNANSQADSPTLDLIDMTSRPQISETRIPFLVRTDKGAGG